jgi:hypothetical protein
MTLSAGNVEKLSVLMAEKCTFTMMGVLFVRRWSHKMNNEPVAWMSQGGDVSRSADYFVEMGFTDLIPLYTHPVKEQDTDCQYCKQGCIRCDARKQLTDEEIQLLINDVRDYDIDTHDLFEFARAILKKASEK